MASLNDENGRVLKRADPSTIQDKFLVGYQGWFTCPGDGPPVHKGHHGWLHWFNKPLIDGGQPTIDLWPDVSSYTPSELFPIPWYTTRTSSPSSSSSSSSPHPMLFSSRHPLTVQRHFHYMAEHGVSGAFLQRFAGQCEVDGRNEGTNYDIMKLRDEVLDRVREAAEKEGRVWAVMYDVSGVPNERIEKVIKVDWGHLCEEKRVLDSEMYLREGGRPVVALWGFGFAGRGHSPHTVRSIIHHIRRVTPGGAYIIAGAPTHWQTLRGDADPNRDFLSVWYNEFDAISPWTVGRFHDEESVDRFAREKLQKDVEALRDECNTGGRRVDYIPVVFPGSSGFNLSHGKWAFNEQPRAGGRFLWRQIYQVQKMTRSRIVYGAMWDEYDEGTAFLPMVSKKRMLPVEGRFLALDEDGYDLPPDWYMRIAGFLGEILRGEREVHETFPVKDLQDYWSSRPKYESLPPPPIPSTSTRPSSSTAPFASSSSASGAEPSGSEQGGGSASASGSGGQTFEEWCEQEKEVEDVPPPPYTLEASEPVEGGPSTQPQPQPPPQHPVQQNQPPVPLQTRPSSLPAQATRVSSTSSSSYVTSAEHNVNRPSSVERPSVSLSSRPSISQQPPPPPASPLASRPTSLPSSSSSTSSSYNQYPGGPSPNANVPYQVYTRPGRRPGPGVGGMSPVEVFHHPTSYPGQDHSAAAGYSPMYLPNVGVGVPGPGPALGQYAPNWNTHPHPQQGQGQGQGQQLRPRLSTSVSDLDERFRQQSLNDRTGQGQWPPSEWGVGGQTCLPPPHPPHPPHPPNLPHPPHPPHPPPIPSLRPSPSTLSPPLHPASRPPHPPGPGFGRASSTSPRPASRPPHSPIAAGVGVGTGTGMPSPGIVGFAQAYPQTAPAHLQSHPHHHHQHHHEQHNQTPYSQHMIPSAQRRSSSSGPDSSAAYTSVYPDVMQGYSIPTPVQGGGQGEQRYAGAGYAGQGQYGDGAGGFYAGPGRPHPHQQQYPYPQAGPSPGRSSYPQYQGGSGSGSGSMSPPHVPPRPSGLMPSIKPGEIMPSSSLSPTSQQQQRQQRVSGTSTSTSPAPAAAPGLGPGHGPGGFVPGSGRLSDTYTRTVGAMNKFETTARKRVDTLQSSSTKMSNDAWKAVEEGMQSVSSAGSKVYQKFRG